MHQVQLVSGLDVAVTGEIKGMEEYHLQDVDSLWQGVLQATEQSDQHWPWDAKWRRAEREDRYEAYALEAEEITQGLLLIETQWHRSVLPARSRLVYVEALASAPWNRRAIEDPPYYRGVGTALLNYAYQRSRALGYGGRIGLHALPDAVSFYRRQGLVDYGPDAEKDGLIYFEQASAL